MRIGKFFSGNENAKDNLKNSTLWFSFPEDFNDPFEGRIKVKKTYEDNTFSSRSEAEKVADLNSEYFYKFNKEFYDHLVGLGALEDKIEFIFRLWADIAKDANTEIINSEGYCCFCKWNKKSLLNQLMWSHYANGLRGFCLVFDQKKLHDSLIEMNDEESLYFEPVKYKDELPELNIYHHMVSHLGGEIDVEDLINDFNIKSRSTKSKVWRYEKEYRAISSRTKAHKYSPDSVKQIFIGGKMPYDEKELVKSLGKSIYKEATIHTVSLEEDHYRLSID